MAKQVGKTAKEAVKKSEMTANNIQFEAIEESLEKWNFQKDQNRVFVGKYKRTDVIQNPNASLEKDKTFEMHVFEELETGEKYHIDSCYTINKTIEKLKADKTDFDKTAIYIEFLGKDTVNNKPFNRFKTGFAAI